MDYCVQNFTQSNGPTVRSLGSICYVRWADTFFRVLHPYSYSYNFSIIYLFAIIVLLLTPLTRQLSAGVLLVFLFSAVAVGSKVSTAPFLVAGFISLTIYRYFKFRADYLRYFLISAISAMSLISVSVFLFYEKDKQSGSEFELGFADLFGRKPL